jgi:hypothetical protein
MKTRALALPFAAAILLTLTACRSVSHSPSVELFNGRDLTGWTPVLADPAVKPEAVWRVKDGILICTGTPIGFIYSDRTVTNFRFVVEYRWPPGSKPGNSGVFSRIHDQFTAIPRCVEAQLLHGSAGDILGLQGMKLATNQARYFFVAHHPAAGDINGVKKLEDREAPPGQWNRVEVLAQGPTYTVWVNGHQVNSAAGVEVMPGHVGLQSEGGEIHFRRATLTPLD